ncbi:MAG: TonB-dependent receptor [Myxococcota bacterium]
MIILWAGLAIAATVVGQIVEVGTGMPVENATLTVDGVVHMVDAEGRFQIEVNDTTLTIQVLSPDHLPFATRAKKLLGKDKVIWLRPNLTLPEIIVEEKQEVPHAMAQVLDKELVERTAGTHDDPIRLLQSLSSVAKTREYGPSAGDVILRAAQPSENRVLLDGVELPYLYHFQQYASVIHTRLLDKVTVYPSAYGARYGDAAGGIVNVETKPSDRQKLSGAANLNLIMGGGAVSQPIKNGVLTVSGRRSHADLYSSGSDQYSAWPVFWDYLSRFDRQVSDGLNLSITAIGARDTYGRRLLDTEGLDPIEQTSNPNFQYDRMFNGVFLRADGRSDSWRANTVIAGVQDRWRGDMGEASSLRLDNYLWVRHQSDVLIADSFQVSGGLDGRMGRVNRIVDTSQSYPTLPDEAPLLSQGISVDDHLNEHRLGVWLEPTVKRSGLSLQPGVRFQMMPSVEHYVLDPRLTVRYTNNIWGLRGGVGQYSQSPTVDAFALNPNLPLTQATHGTVGTDLFLFDDLKVSVDLWSRQTENGIYLNPYGTAEVVDTSAFGGEVGLSYRLKDRLFAWVSFSSANIRQAEAFWAYDQPYAVDGVFSWRFHPKWDIGFRYRYAAGLPYTEPSGSTYQADTNAYSPEYSIPFDSRLPDYQKVDFHIARRKYFGPVTMTTYMELWLVPPKANVLYPIYNYNYLQNKQVIGPPIVPLVGVRFEN